MPIPRSSSGAHAVAALLSCAAVVFVLSHQALADTPLAGSIMFNRTLTLSESPYLVTSEVVVWNEATLTIEPGVVLRFEPAGALIVGLSYSGYYGCLQGTLIANGTAEAPILFTSTSGAPGGWQGIFFTGCSYGSSLTNCVVENGGLPMAVYGSATYTANVVCMGSQPVVSECTIRNAQGNGMDLIGVASLAITDCAIRNNSGHGINCGYFSSPVITGTAFTDNLASDVVSGWEDFPVLEDCTFATGTHFGVEGYFQTIRNCQFSGSAAYGLAVAVGSGIENLTLSGYADPNAILLTGLAPTGDPSGNVVLPALGPGQYYAVESPLTIRDNITLSVSPGVTIKFGPSATLTIGYRYWDNYGEQRSPGTLIAVGTPTAMITFTSLSGETAGWSGMNFASGCPNSRLDYCLVENGGVPGEYGLCYDIYNYNNTRITNSIVRNAPYCIYSNYSSYEFGSPVVNGCALVGASIEAIHDNYRSGGQDDATGNWWGDPTGPYDPDGNPEGRGSSVGSFVNRINYRPWLDCPPPIGEYRFGSEPTTPTVPTGLAAVNEGTGSTITATWRPVLGATGYVLRVSDGVTTTDHSVPSTTHTAFGLARGAEYSFSAAAMNDCGMGAFSTPITKVADYYPVLLVNGLCSDTELWTECTVPALGVSELPDCQPSSSHRLGDVLHGMGISRLWAVGYDRNRRLYSDVPTIASAIDHVLASTGERRLNLVAHSQGGLVCRSLLQTRSQYRDKVANLVMLGTPNHGSALANLAGFNLFAPFTLVGKIKAKVACLFNSEAVYDLVPGSAFLQQLNYGPTPCGESHRCDSYLWGSCGAHQAEDLPRGSAGGPEYWLLAGTGGWCAVETKLDGLIGCTPNDGVVGVDAARLTALPSSRWTTDEVIDGGRSSTSHFGRSAGCGRPEEVQYAPFAEAAFRILTDVPDPLTPLGAPDAKWTRNAAGESTLPVALLPSVVGHLDPEVTRRDTLTIDSSSEVGFLLSSETTGPTFEVVSPIGQRFTRSDTAGGLVRYVQDANLAVQELTVTNPIAGPWIVESTLPAGLSPQNFELVPSVRSSVQLVLALPSDPVPGEPLSVVASLVGPSGPDTAASFAGQVTLPDSSSAPLAFSDDGAHGDGTAGDGIFGATYVPGGSGLYGLTIEAHESGGGTSRVQRTAFMIESLPDLAVLRPDLMIQRTRPGGPPDSLSVATAVRKHELVDAAGGLLEVQNGSGELLTSQPLAVAANGQSTITALWMPRDVNWDTLIVVVNPNAAFLEQRTDNDTLRIELNPSTVSVADHQALTLSLAQSRPNPMRRDVLVQFSLPEPANVKLSVYDVAGREVRMILAGFLNAGIHSVRWDGSGKDGQPAAAGVYFYRLRVGGQALARRLVILR